MIKILYLIGDLDIGGAERHLVQILPELKDRCIQPTVYTLTHKGIQSNILESKGIRVECPFYSKLLRKLPSALRRAITPLMTLPKLLIVLSTGGFDIVHYFLPAPYLIGGLCGVFVGPKVRIMSRRSQNLYREKYTYISRIETWLHGRTQALIGNSMAILEDLKTEGSDIKRCGLIYNGIDINRYDVEESESKKIIDKLQLNNKGVVIVITANLIPYKGHRDLLKALSILDDKCGPWILLCIGKDTGIKNNLEELAIGYGISSNIMWLGLRTDVPEILSVCDIAVLSSHEEGFPNSILEYMAAKLPVVATNVGGVAELVMDNSTGILVSPRTPRSLAEALKKLIVDKELRINMGKQGYERVAQKFSLDSCIDRYCTLYNGLLSMPLLPVSSILDTKSTGS